MRNGYDIELTTKALLASLIRRESDLHLAIQRGENPLDAAEAAREGTEGDIREALRHAHAEGDRVGFDAGYDEGNERSENLRQRLLEQERLLDGVIDICCAIDADLWDDSRRNGKGEYAKVATLLFALHARIRDLAS